MSARPVRALIDAARRGWRLTRHERHTLGTLLDLYYREPCRRCRRPGPDETPRDGRCEECVEVIAREGR